MKLNDTANIILLINIDAAAPRIPYLGMVYKLSEMFMTAVDMVTNGMIRFPFPVMS